MAVTWVPDDGERTRVAYAVGRAVGGAVVRNRVRRRLRAVVAEIEPQLRPGAYLLSAGREAATMPYRELRSAVSQAVTAAAQAPPPSPARGR